MENNKGRNIKIAVYVIVIIFTILGAIPGIIWEAEQLVNYFESPTNRNFVFVFVGLIIYTISIIIMTTIFNSRRKIKKRIKSYFKYKSPSKVKQLILDIDNAREDILILAQSQKEEDNPYPKDEKSFEEYTKRSSQYSKSRQLIYRRDNAPKVKEIIRRGEIILGPNNPAIIEAKEKQRSADVNFICMRKMAEALSSIRAELVLKQKKNK